MTLSGLEPVQQDYVWYRNNRVYENKAWETPYSVTVLLVMTKFVILVDRSLRAGSLNKPVPVFATAHDFEIVARFGAQ